MNRPVIAPDRTTIPTPASARRAVRPIVPADSRIFGGWGVRF
jgi:hypothetical protein